MEAIEEILATVRERAQQLNLPYAGALLPAEAHKLMQTLAEARLVDVRIRAELEWVGKSQAALRSSLDFHGPGLG